MLKGKVLRGQSRETLYRVHGFFKREAQRGVRHLDDVTRRTAEATGVSVATVQTVLDESRKSDVGAVFETQEKKRAEKKTRTEFEIDDLTLGVIKRCVHRFHETDEELPTVQKILAKLRTDINFKGSASNLSTAIKKLGFKWKKTENKKKILIEKPEIRLKRIEYLKKIKAFRREGRNIVYIGETYVHAAPGTSNSWSNSSINKQPLAKGKRLIVAHAGSRNGLLGSALLMFPSGNKSGDYNDDMNFNNFHKWVLEMLLPNLLPNSIVVLDNAPYHNKLAEFAPSSNSKKCIMEEWLRCRGVEFNPNMLKPQMYQLICAYKPKDKTYIIDNIFDEYSHCVLRLPPYHPDLNPIELALASIKEYVAQKNVDWNTDRVKDLVKERFDLMNHGEWTNLCRKVEEIETQYMESEIAIDTLTEQFIIRADHISDSGTSDESEDDGAASNCCASSCSESDVPIVPKITRSSKKERSADDQCEYVLSGASESKKKEEAPGGLRCNECGVIITGFRYKCVTCDDYDMCSACEALGTHEQHLMIRIARPLNTKNPRALLKRWCEAIKTVGIPNFKKVKAGTVLAAVTEAAPRPDGIMEFSETDDANNTIISRQPINVKFQPPTTTLIRWTPSKKLIKSPLKKGAKNKRRGVEEEVVKRNKRAMTEAESELELKQARRSSAARRERGLNVDQPIKNVVTIQPNMIKEEANSYPKSGIKSLLVKGNQEWIVPRAPVYQSGSPAPVSGIVAAQARSYMEHGRKHVAYNSGTDVAPGSEADVEKCGTRLVHSNGTNVAQSETYPAHGEANMAQSETNMTHKEKPEDIDGSEIANNDMITYEDLCGIPRI